MNPTLLTNWAHKSQEKHKTTLLSCCCLFISSSPGLGHTRACQGFPPWPLCCLCDLYLSWKYIIALRNFFWRSQLPPTPTPPHPRLTSFDHPVTDSLVWCLPPPPCSFTIFAFSLLYRTVDQNLFLKLVFPVLGEVFFLVLYKSN